MKKIIIAFAAAACASIAYSTAPEFSLGADISDVTHLESKGVQFLSVDSVSADLYDIMKAYGINGVRLRVWLDPKDKFCSPEDVLRMAVRAKEKGLPVMVDFHYSDWWADPAKQNIPERWKNLSYEQMKGALAEHTAATLQMLRDNGVDVPWVQVGNETSHGFLWPMGKAEDNMAQYAGLTQAGYDAVKSVYPDAQVIVHLDNGFDSELYNRIFDGLKKNGAKWDMIGMSIYPLWSMQSGKIKNADELLTKALKNIRELKKKYGTDIMVTEIGVEANDPVSGKAFIAKALDAFYNQTDGACRGVWYWAPEADGILDGYKLGAFQNRRPTIIMDAFREFRP